ncbi:MAG: LysM peptidoglycan-binding domain-containing protein [Verrucomicrobia bacterium]|nr:LysM peptidoglycan-binding domain-containing protein [Verrucomicrobiota bacterium]
MRRSPFRSVGKSLCAVFLTVCASGALAAAEAIRHTVRPGDTVPRLSWQYKIRADRIRAANRLSGDALTPGRVLLIPGPEEKEEGGRKKEEGVVRLAPAAAAEGARSTAVVPSSASVVRPERAELPPPSAVDARRSPVGPGSNAVPRPERAELPPVSASAPRAAVATRPGPAELPPPPVTRAVPVPRSLPPPVPGPLPGPRDEPLLEAVAPPPRSARLAPGLSRELPRVPEERAESVRPGRAPARSVEPPPEEEPAAPQPAPARRDEPPPRAAGTPGQALIQAAQRLAREGIPYNGSWTPPGERNAWVMDCSNTARWLYKSALGIDLPRTASDQYLAFQRAGKLRKAPRGWFSKEVNRGRLDRDLRTGDLLFWENTYRPVRNPDITHVMVFLGTDPQGRWMMAGSEGKKGVNIYTFDPDKKKGGYSTFLGLFKHHGRFVAYARGI